MSDPDEAEETKFEVVMAKVLPNEEVSLERGDPLVDLDIKPDEVVARKEHQSS